MTFKVKPPVVQAIQWTGDNLTEVTAFVVSGGLDTSLQSGSLYIVRADVTQTLVMLNHWLILGDLKQLSTLDPDTFASLFEEE